MRGNPRGLRFFDQDFDVNWRDLGEGYRGFMRSAVLAGAYIPQHRHGGQQKRAEALPRPSFGCICVEDSNALGDAVSLFRLSRKCLACLVRYPGRDLGNPARALNGLLQIVPHEGALGSHDVWNGSAARQRAEIIEVLLQALLREAEPLAREVLDPARQHGAGLDNHLQVLGPLAGEFLTSLARDAISLRHLIGEALGVRGSRV
jgi:hypothetical protein